MRRTLGITLWLVLQISSNQSTGSEFILNEYCPRGFELIPAEGCRLRTLYQFYSSNQDRGVGGTRTGLPPVRDGYSPQQIDLGRYLFFDPVLSANQTISCASCHQPRLGFADGLAVSRGIHDRRGTRSAPSLWNAAFNSKLFWDARSDSLEQQAQEPLYSPLEMGNSPNGLLARLQAVPEYQTLFEQAFPNSGLNLPNLYTALAAFQASLISLNSRYDQYVHGNHQALSEDELAGLNVFRSFVARCSECHTPPLFTNNQIAVIGAPEPEGVVFDVGAQRTYSSPKLRGGFKVPTLRNIERTAPYMHSGVFADLREATEFYNLGRGHAAPDDLQIHWHITSPDLSELEIDQIVAFMHTLTDERFMPDTPQKVPSGLAVDHNHKQLGQELTTHQRSQP
ncbi:hypothetical protein GCM10008090_32490 [Arenicella chitinivorans]|uniref:Methylamine utilization protein MauG n=1 Tax=Arenicella chitinivorans TaxID=1329800 RepID=A0A918VSA9_9GAMM|nr:cytochrome c peroxidase [Arenicella chitinivorans]GHA20113.1 hypothetical protein GCM10008090_32490 [Arenicella chitinivorans]